MGYIYTHKKKAIIKGHKLTVRSKNKVKFIQCECGLKWRYESIQSYDNKGKSIIHYDSYRASRLAQEHLSKYS
jgi:hypothetical protein